MDIDDFETSNVTKDLKPSSKGIYTIVIHKPTGRYMTVVRQSTANVTKKMALALFEHEAKQENMNNE